MPHPGTNERKYPNIVELAVGKDGLDVGLGRRIMAFHNSRHIKPRYGHIILKEGENSLADRSTNLIADARRGALDRGETSPGVVGATCAVPPELTAGGLMNEKALIEIFAGMASLVRLVSGPHRDERRKIAIRVAAIRRTKVGYQQIQRHNEMALSPPYAFTFAIAR
jgi:hypothetical protein